LFSFTFSKALLFTFSFSKAELVHKRRTFGSCFLFFLTLSKKQKIQSKKKYEVKKKEKEQL
jgi:hypothetical protein